MKFLRDTPIMLLLASAAATDATNDATRSIAEKIRSSDDMDITANGFCLHWTGLEVEADKLGFTSAFRIDARLNDIKWMGSNDIVKSTFFSNYCKLIGTNSKSVSSKNRNLFGISFPSI